MQKFNDSNDLKKPVLKRQNAGRYLVEADNKIHLYVIGTLVKLDQYNKISIRIDKDRCDYIFDRLVDAIQSKEEKLENIKNKKNKFLQGFLMQ